MKVQGGRWFWD